MFDQVHDLRVVPSLNPVSRNASGNGTGVDRKGYEAVTIAVSIGAAGPAGSFEIQHSNSASSGFAAVPDNQLVGTEAAAFTVAAADANKVGTIGYIGDRRYVRVRYARTSGTGINAAYVILGRPHSCPTPDQAL